MSTAPERLQWIVFDLGETLIDETANWDRWADYLLVPRFTFHGVLGAVVGARRPHTDVFEYFRVGFNLAVETAAKDAAGLGWTVSDDDLYDDVRPGLANLRSAGYRLAVIANQPHGVETFMATLPVDVVATSAQWNLAKPDPRFFERMASILGAPARSIAYVGDRVDNDVLPAKRAGMVAVHLRRGPWGYVHAEWPEALAADLRVDSLTDVGAGLAALDR